LSVGEEKGGWMRLKTKTREGAALQTAAALEYGEQRHMQKTDFA